MNNDLRKEQKNEAIRRIKQLTERFNLNPNILKYFKEDKIYYSYEVIPGFFITSIDNITYDQKYVDLVKNLEKEYGVLVYHCILTGNQFTMLYVSEYKDEWSVGEITDDNYILAGVHDFDSNYFEFGSVLLSSLNGALLRIG